MLCGVCIALCTALNSAFASLGTFSQYYIPLFICLLICPAPYAIVCAIASPLFSMVVCGQPAAALFPGMLAECLTFTLVCMLSLKLLHKGEKNTGLIVTLVCAAAFGRISAGLVNSVIFTDGVNSTALWTAGAALRAVPDIIILTVVSVELKTFLDHVAAA